MNILFYTPLNTRSRDIESQSIEFEKEGHSIFLLTLSPRHILHQKFESYGHHAASTESSFTSSYITMLQRLLRFMVFCNRNRIDLVYSHLEPANFIAVLGQFLIKAKVVICRHHVDFARLSGFDHNFSYRLTYKLAKDIIVVSRLAKDYMVREEGVNEGKIHEIDLAYNFDLYGPIDRQEVQEIRRRYKAQIVLLTVGRLDPHKRPELSIQLVRQLIDMKKDVKLLILGDGALFQALQSKANELGVSDRVFFLGYVNNVLDYMAASDFLVHPSISESSCITVKEAGLADLPPIVCEGVGNFDEIFKNGYNGFLIKKDDFVNSSAFVIQDQSENKENIKRIGSNLRASILERFDIRKVTHLYERMFHHLR